MLKIFVIHNIFLHAVLQTMSLCIFITTNEPVFKGNITGLDLDPTGKHMASIDDHGTLLISEVDTNAYSTHYSLQSIERKYAQIFLVLRSLLMILDSAGHQCKWTKDANLYVSYNGNKINVFDPEKRALLYENAVKPGCK